MDAAKVMELVTLLKQMVKHIQAVGDYEGKRLENGLELQSASPNFQASIVIKYGQDTTTRVP